MNLESLINKLQEIGCIKASRLANIKMSARYYAQALGCRTAADCEEETFVLDKLIRNQKIETYLKENVSVHTLRNTKNDISFLLKQADRLNLIQSFPQNLSQIEEKRFGRRKISPYLPSIIAHKDTNFNKDSYSLPLEKWSEKLRQQYDEWLKWVTTERERIQGIDSYNRPATVETKTRKMEAFFGFLSNVKETSDLDFRMLLDVAAKNSEDFENAKFVQLREERHIGLLEEFIHWHWLRYDGKISSQVRAIISLTISIASKFYLPKAIKEERSELVKTYYTIKMDVILPQCREII